MFFSSRPLSQHLLCKLSLGACKPDCVVGFRAAAAAVYLSRPTGYVDLPGGVTIWSCLLLFLTGGCAVGLLCCLVSQCRAYGGMLSRGKSHTGHVL